MGDLRIKTSIGWLEGRIENGAAVWKGIPYAKPPVGERRFAAPEPPEPWEGVRTAATFGPPALQPGDPAQKYALGADTPPPSEDCLYLNIWAPLPGQAKGPLPVMVWIHGGAFVTGFGGNPAYDAAALASRGEVIVVTINYRLGPFGFMHLAPLGDGFASNAGLLDQIAALAWVRREIAAFGGDPGQVTAFGESAGAMSIAALLAMPAARGLFGRAILQSGAAQTLTEEQADQIVASMLLLLGIDRADARQLKALPAAAILEAAEELMRMLGGGPAMIFQPVAGVAELPAGPLEAIAAGTAADVPLLIGTNLHEGHYFIREGMTPMPMEGAIRGVELMTGIADAEPLVRAYPHTAAGQAEAITDLFFWRSALQLALAQHRHAPVWMYRFDWTSAAHPELARAVHTREIVFVFGNLPLLERQLGVALGPEAHRLADEMQAAWLAFAKQGAPETAGLAWPRYAEPERLTMMFGAPAGTGIVPDPDVGKRARLGI